jgi:hypothetical protein
VKTNPADITVEEWVAAIERSGLTSKQEDLLRYLHGLPEHTMTAAAAARAMGWKSWSVTNRQYGEIAKRIGGALGRRLEVEYWIFGIFYNAGKDEEGHTRLRMRQHFATAVGRLLAGSPR